MEILNQLYKEEWADFEQRPKRVEEWLSTGEYPVNPNLDQTALATCAVIASTIMNFEEFSIKK